MSIAEEKNDAFNKLKALEANKVILTRNVFFIPGWTSESCAAWQEPYTKENIAMREWAERLISNWQEKIHFITFTEAESKVCKSFIDFSSVLAEKVSPYLVEGTQLDLIGHSMGGLDISAGIINGAIPSKYVKNVITLGSPFHGAEWGGVMKTVSAASWFFPAIWAIVRAGLKKKYSYYHFLQLENMNPQGGTIRAFDKTENRVKLLESVDKLYTFVGTDDDTVKQSAFFNNYAVPADLLGAKLNAICFGGATHSGQLGLPQDPRVVLNIMRIISS